MQFLTIAMIIEIHTELINEFGGMHGIRDENLLDSATAYPEMLYTIGQEKNIYLLAAAYCYHLINNHPFIDGNKRIGTVAMITFLRMNDHHISMSNAQFYELGMRTATSQITEQELADELEQYAMAQS